MCTMASRPLLRISRERISWWGTTVSCRRLTPRRWAASVNVRGFWAWGRPWTSGVRERRCWHRTYKTARDSEAQLKEYTVNYVPNSQNKLPISLQISLPNVLNLFFHNSKYMYYNNFTSKFCRGTVSCEKVCGDDHNSNYHNHIFFIPLDWRNYVKQYARMTVSLPSRPWGMVPASDWGMLCVCWWTPAHRPVHHGSTRHRCCLMWAQLHQTPAKRINTLTPEQKDKYFACDYISNAFSWKTEKVYFYLNFTEVYS